MAKKSALGTSSNFPNIGLSIPWWTLHSWWTVVPQNIPLDRFDRICKNVTCVTYQQQDQVAAKWCIYCMKFSLFHALLSWWVIKSCFNCIVPNGYYTEPEQKILPICRGAAAGSWGMIVMWSHHARAGPSCTQAASPTTTRACPPPRAHVTSWFPL